MVFQTIRVPRFDRITYAFGASKEEKRYVVFRACDRNNRTKEEVEIRVKVESIGRDESRLNLVIKGTATINEKTRKVLCSFNTLTHAGSIIAT